MKMKSKRQTGRKHGQRRKTSFPKKLVENVKLSKTVLNKIMTTYE